MIDGERVVLVAACLVVFADCFGWLARLVLLYVKLEK